MSAASVLYMTAQLGGDLPGIESPPEPRNVTPHIRVNTQNVQLVIGVVLAIAGNLIISISLNVQKHVHNRNEARPESERQPFTRQPLWWAGFGGTIIGEVGNFLAFGFAGADIVTPLGAVAVVSNACIAWTFMDELFRIRDALGVLLTCLGSVLVVIKAPTNEADVSVSVFLDYACAPIFATYMAVVLVVIVVLYRVLPRVRHITPAFGLLLCAQLGTITVLCATALANFLRVTFNGDLQFDNWVPYALIAIMVPSGMGQVRFLNETMEIYDNTQVRVRTLRSTFRSAGNCGGILSCGSPFLSLPRHLLSLPSPSLLPGARRWSPSTTSSSPFPPSLAQRRSTRPSMGRRRRRSSCS